jgi:hypothetical protein
MLSDLDLCKDIAEFSQFATALRGGLPAESPRPAAARQTTTDADTEISAVQTPSKVKLGGIAVVVVGLALLLIGGFALLFAAYVWF